MRWRLAMRNELLKSRFLRQYYGGWSCVMSFQGCGFWGNIYEGWLWLLKSRFLRQCLWRLTMCNGLLKSRFWGNIYEGWLCVMSFQVMIFLAHKETGQRSVEYTQHELILTSLLGEQVLIDTDRRHHKKVWVHCLSLSALCLWLYWNYVKKSVILIFLVLYLDLSMLYY